MRTKTLIIGFLIILAWINIQIVLKESIRTHRTRLLLRVDSVEPESFVPGSYVRLRYEIIKSIPDSQGSGVLHVKRNANDVGLSIEPVESKKTVPLRYYHSKGVKSFGVDLYLFEQGQGLPEKAIEYAELKVSARGVAQLVDLLDGDLQPVIGER